MYVLYRESSVEMQKYTRPEGGLTISYQHPNISGTNYTPSDPRFPKVPTPSHTHPIKGK